MTRPEQALLPCPFCGGDAIFEQDRSDGPRSLRWSAGCRDEMCMGYMGPTFPRRADALEAWNRREALLSRAATTQAGDAKPDFQMVYTEMMRILNDMDDETFERQLLQFRQMRYGDANEL